MQAMDGAKAQAGRSDRRAITDERKRRGQKTRPQLRLTQSQCDHCVVRLGQAAFAQFSRIPEKCAKAQPRSV
jgi:hypothetical protein